MSLRDAFEGLVALWGWYIDLPLVFPVAITILVILGALMIVARGSDPSE